MSSFGDDDLYLYDDDTSSNDSDPDDPNVDDGIDMEMNCLDENPRSSDNYQDRNLDDESSYEILTTEQIVEFMVDSIKEVNNVIQISTTTVRILLNHFKWDKEKLMETFFSDQQDQMFKEAKIMSPYMKSGNKKSSSKLDKNIKTKECQICYFSMPISMMKSLACNHLYCNKCWVEYLTTKIVNEGASQSIECPGDCKMLVDDETVMTLIDDKKIKVKYQHLITNSFVQCNRLLRWCSAPDCNYAAKVSSPEARPIKCKCGFIFCFNCSESWHDPVRCHLIKKWIKKCDDDSETANWISANTKECPKCQATIEKDGGCNHVICKNQTCKADFCWVCLGPWEPHGSSWYNCNRFDEEEARNARTGQERSRAALQRYLFYCNRYMNHHQSLKFEHKLYAIVKNKMEEMQTHNMSWIEVQFLKKAVDILCECRRTLMFTYVFAYYLSKNNQSELFEANQKDLETATEVLSEYLERDINAANVIDIKQRVQDKYRYCDNRRKVLLNHVHEGYDMDWWLYNEN